MYFCVISEDEARKIFEKNPDKKKAINIIADLTVSSCEEVAQFLGVKLINKRPWVIETEKEEK